MWEIHKSGSVRGIESPHFGNDIQRQETYYVYSTDAKKMIEKGITNADIRDITGLSIKKIQELRKNSK